MAMKRILVAVDDSDASRRVATFVNYFFGGSDVEILALNVAPAWAPWIPPGAIWGALYSWPAAYWNNEAGIALEEQREAESKSERIVVNSGIEEAKPVVEAGDPVVAIRRSADEQNVDMIVVGSHDKGLLTRIFNPSVSRELAHHPTRPLLIVP
jgi:nucleotide-binding universal stress UspA family protein